MTAPELKPCPFCGSTDVTTHLDCEQGEKWGYANCDACASRGPEVRTSYDRGQGAPWRSDAITEWNNRADLSIPTDAMAAPRDKLLYDPVPRKDVQLPPMVGPNGQRIYTEAELQAAIAAAMMGAVKPLEWQLGIVDYARPLAGVKYIACIQEGGSCSWWLDGEKGNHQVYKSETEAKSAAEADWQARNAAIRVIPTDAMAALAERERQAEQRALDQACKIIEKHFAGSVYASSRTKALAEIRAMQGGAQ